MTKSSYRMLFIGGAPAGLLGLDELLQSLYEAGLSPDDPAIGAQLLHGIGQQNYIPKTARGDYEAALINEYRRYTLSCQGVGGSRSKGYGFWEGIPRENIPWLPTVSPDLCNGCGKCLEVCPKDVFRLSTEGKAMVLEPFLCIVGCCFCKSACDPHAILMPPRSMLDQYRTGLMGR